MSPQTGLTCPKCREAMTSYERGGVIVDQCTGCRGSRSATLTRATLAVTGVADVEVIGSGSPPAR